MDGTAGRTEEHGRGRRLHFGGLAGRVAAAPLGPATQGAVAMKTAAGPDTVAARGLKLVDLEHAAFVENPNYVNGGTDPLWIRSKGASLREGNYRLFYTDAAGNPFANGAPSFAPSEKLLLEIGDRRHRIDVSHVANGAGIGEACLHRLLDCVALRRAWGQDVACRLIFLQNGDDAATSDPVRMKTPVAPWVQAVEPALFADDPGIRHCGDLKKGTRRGRILRRYAGRLFFTFKDALETDVTLRGFSSIGLVGSIYGVPPGAAYATGAAMAVFLNGTAFDWADRPKTGRTSFRGRHSRPDEAAADRSIDSIDEKDFVKVDRGLLLGFMKSAEARAGTFLIWTGGHAGLLRNGVLYECKPSGKGFTKEVYTPGVQSAVRRFDASQLATQLKSGPYYLSKLPE